MVRKSAYGTVTKNQMQTDETESRLHSVQQNLLADMEAMQGALPDNGEDTSEALERRARIVAMPTRAFDVLNRACLKHWKQFLNRLPVWVA